MNDLERFAAALLAQWRAEGNDNGGPVAVGAVLDRTFPYRLARRVLGIDVSEDYEALVLRMVAEEDALVTTHPIEAAEMARATMASKLPDLDVLQLLRAAEVTFAPETVARLDGVLPMPAPREESKWASPKDASVPEPEPERLEEAAYSREDIIPLPVSPALAEAVAEATASAADPVALDEPATPAAEPAPVAGPPPEFPTSVSFTPPGEDHCWSCAETLPANRRVNFCPYCGADQRQPTCHSCGTAVERRWKHCPECGLRLWDGGA